MVESSYDLPDVNVEAGRACDSKAGVLGKVEDVFTGAAVAAKQLYKSLSDGGPTGITGDFGKPLIFDGTKPGQDLSNIPGLGRPVLDFFDNVPRVDGQKPVGAPKSAETDKADAVVAHNELVTGRPGIEWPGEQTWYRQGKDTPSPAPEPGMEPSDGSPDDGKAGFSRAPFVLPWEQEFQRVVHRKPASPEGEWRADDSSEKTNADGSISRVYADHCEVVSDKDGQVTALTRPDGRKTTFEYDDKKQLEKVTFGDGYTYKKENGAWQMYDDKGNDIGTATGELSVTREGEIIYAQEDGSLKQVKHRDGSVTTSRSDETVVELDKDASIKSLTRPDGKITTFDYDQRGELSKITFGDGFIYKKENGAWTMYDDHGQKMGPAQGKFSVTADGEITFTANDGSLKSVKHRDGSTTNSRSDETVVELDADARVKSITYKDGASNSVDYQDGKPCRIVHSDGSTWVKDGDGWNAYKDGKKTDHLDGEIDVNSQGDIEITHKDGSKVITHRNGVTEAVPA